MNVDTPVGGNSLAIGVGVGYDMTSNIGFEGELGHLFDIVGDDEVKTESRRKPSQEHGRKEDLSNKKRSSCVFLLPPVLL